MHSALTSGDVGRSVWRAQSHHTHESNQDLPIKSASVAVKDADTHVGMNPLHTLENRISLISVFCFEALPLQVHRHQRSRKSG